MRHRTASVCCLFYRSILLFLIVFVLAGGAGAQNLTINPGLSTLFAGDATGKLGLSSQSYTGLASGLVLKVPGKLLTDSANNLYEIESGNNIVRVIAGSSNPIPVLPGVSVQAGYVYTVAGTTNSSAPSSIPCSGGIDVQGNGCPATQATISGDALMALDGNGNLYIADNSYQQIRVVYSGKGTIVGLSSPKQGYIYAITNTNNSGKNQNPSTPTQASQATVPGIFAITVDSNGNIYTYDQWYYNISMIYQGGNLPSNFFGSATPTPGTLYTLNAGTQNCPEAFPGVCDGQPIANASFYNEVDAMAVDASGNIYMGDDAAHEIRVVYIAGTIPNVADPTPGDIYAIAGNNTSGAGVNGPALSSPLALNYQAMAFAVDSIGDVYFTTGAPAGAGASVNVDKIDPSGNLTVLLGGTSPCAAPTDILNDGCAASAFTPSGSVGLDGLAVDSAGNLYVANNPGGVGLSVIAESNVSTTTLDFPGTIGLVTTPQTIYLSNTSTQSLQLSGLTFTGPFQQLTSGSNNCSSSTTLASGESCQIEISFLPTQSGGASGSLTIASNAQNATGGVNTVSLLGNAAKATSTTALSANPGYPAIANAGQSVTLTAMAVPEFQDTLVPTGTITFLNGSTTLGSASISNGVATITSSGFAAGTYTVTAVYSGDSNFTGSTSSPAKLIVSSTPVAEITLTPSVTTAISGQSVTLNATAAAFSGGGVPTGIINFQVGGSPLPNGTVTLSNGAATLTTTALPVGTDDLVAVYSGDSNFGANVSDPAPVVVGSAAQIQLIPGLISQVSGSYFTTSNSGPANNTGATSAQYPSYTSNVAVDSYGNTYVVASANYVGLLYVTASGNGPIPGVANPVKGNIYQIGTGKQCSISSAAPCGDGGPVSGASFFALHSIAVDALNNIYVGDEYVVRKISASTGIINTIAGTWGINGGGYSGDGGPATSAQFDPTAIFADPNGNLYIADNNALLVREVNGQTGIITTVAGITTGAGQQTAGGPVNECQNVPCGDGGPATSANLVGPTAIFVDNAGNIYIADNGNYVRNGVSGTPQVVRKITSQTGLISLYAGKYTDGPYLQPCGPNSGISCGDGGPATDAIFNSITGLSGDQSGNLYVADNNLDTIREINAQSGIVQTVVGTANGASTGSNQCTAGIAPCGDGGPATSATLNNPAQVAVDSQGDIYYFDRGADVVREVTGATTALAYGSQTLGSFTPLTVTVNNSGSQPLAISDLTVPLNYEQQASGGIDCASNISLNPGDACQLDIAFFPTATGALPATLTIASNAVNATSGQNTIALTGTGVSAGGTQSQTITFNPPAGPFYEGEQIPLTASASSGLTVEYQVTSGSGIILNNGTASATLKITGAGNLTVTAYQFGNSQYAASSNTPQITLSATQPVLTITATVPSLVGGTPLPAYTSSTDYSITGYIPGDTSSVVTGQPSITVEDSTGAVVPVGTVLQAGSTYTVVITQGTLSFPSYYKSSFVNGTLNVTGSNLQTISFTGLPANITYNGAVTYALNAIASDAVTGKPNGLPISYSVTTTPPGGNPSTTPLAGNTLPINGAGTFTVTATQIGNAYYASASATQTIQVAKAALTVTAVSLTYAQGVPLPALTSASDYTITGFVAGDSQAVVTGQPALSIIDVNGLAGNPGAVLAPGVTPPVGTYVISISTGFLTATNYNFNFVAGTLTVSNGAAQAISFPPIANVAYGAAPITLGATASSGLGVSYTVSPSNMASLSGNTLAITGAGVVTVTASQPGNSVYAPAQPVQQSFTVVPAVLTVTANNATRTNDTPNPPFTYTITGFVNGDTQGVAVSGTASLTTTATTASPIGEYPITFATGQGANTLLTTNYTFNYVPGTLTITTGGPVPDYTLTANPQSLAVSQGQIAQTQVTLTPFNYYQGLVSLSCGSLPANVTCTFSPATLAANGNNQPVSTTLTINTNSAAPIVGELRPQSGTPVLAAFYLPGAMAALLVAFRRRRAAKHLMIHHWLMLIVLLAGAAGLTACGGGAASSSGTLAAPGNSVITVTAADSSSNVSHTLNFSLTIR